MIERDLEKKLKEGVKRLGGVVYKLDARTHKGAPDRVVVLPGRETIFVELKTDTGRLSLLQQVELSKIQSAGGRTRVIYGLAALGAFLEI